MKKGDALSLPKGWEIKKLGEVCTIKPPKKFAKEQLSDEEFITFLPMADLKEFNHYINPVQIKKLKDVYKGYVYFENNDVLLAKITPCFENGKLGIAQNLKNGIGFGSSEYMVFRPGANISSEYIYYFLSLDFIRNEGKYRMTGAVGHKRIPVEYISNQNLIVPPLPEQKRIVAILDRVFSVIERSRNNAEQNLKNAKELFESYLNRIFDPSTRSGQEGEDWEEKRLGEIGKVSMCKRILKKQTSSTGDIPFYKIGTFGKTANAFISKEIYEDYRSKYSFPKKGDILLSASGTIGRRVVYDDKPAYFQDSNIVWIDNDEKNVLNKYLYHFYGFCDWNPSRGATISRLYNDDLRRINIPFPKSKEQQKQIVQKLDQLQAETKKLEAIYQKKIEDLEELKKSVLQKAFNGELS